MTLADSRPKGRAGRAGPSRRADLVERFTRLYGASPLHLLAISFGFALAGYVASILIKASHPIEILEWIAGAIIAHDLILFPIYTAADRLLTAIGARPRRPPLVPWLNHVRAPVVISGILLLMFFPLVFNLSETDYYRAQGLTTSVYLQRWTIVAGSLFAISALIYAARLARALIRRGGRTSRQA